MNTPGNQSSSEIYDYILKSEKSRRIYEKVVKKSSDHFLDRFVQKIIWLSDNIRAESDVMYSDWERQNYLGTDWAVLLENLTGLDKNLEIRSSLLLTSTFNKNIGSYDEIKWLIDDKEVFITCSREDKKEGSIYSYKWAIDWQKITDEDARMIFEKYYDIAKKRTDRIDNIRSENVKIWIRKKTGAAVEGILSV
ncbi:MAG: hypothetical protein ACD_49C00066G0021 [uncultured bacterium (gcode 4)]|uniref:Uncharacterized protein n=1 Tax=uncultured bacterium (gcode 4) TaxID=1234023 RepID=K2AWD3_9BACT|nr:MAG: hypothetical protein ACD_49C00066G0021 [uncultured bacterium (gcode 4)]